MKIDIEIPETLKELRLEQYQKYMKLITNNEASEFVNQKTIEIFCDLPLKDIAKINYNSVNEILEHFNKLFSAKNNLIPTFKLAGKKFGFIPDLENMSFGEYVDLDEYLKDIDNWHRAMAVLYRPVTKEVKGLYQIEDYKGSDQYAEVMKFAPLDVVLGSMVFFYNLSNELLNAMIAYLQHQVTEHSETLVENSNSLTNGDGINQSMQSLKETLSTLNALPSFHYTNV
jgi:hypothetical protein